MPHTNEAQITLRTIVAEIVLKDIMNVHLSVYLPNGHCRISAPERMTLDNIRAYAVSKLAWIKKQQKKLREEESERGSRPSSPNGSPQARREARGGSCPPNENQTGKLQP